jgi:uncharacterized CHY-type Zn-finger protein
MSYCKDCFNFELCANGYGEVTADTEITNIKGKPCHYFKDRSKMIELPCKVGDTIYRLVFCKDETQHPMTYSPSHYIKETVVGLHICDSRLRVNALSNSRYRDYLIVNNNEILSHISVNKIGKTVFLTREQAEQALREKT